MGNSHQKFLKQKAWENRKMILSMISLAVFLFFPLLYLWTKTWNHSSRIHHHIIFVLYFLDHYSFMLLKKTVAVNYIVALAFIFIVQKDVFWQWLKKQIHIFFKQFVSKNIAKLWLKWGVDSGRELSRTCLIVRFHPDVQQACLSCPGLLQSRASECLFPKCTSKFNHSVYFFWACMSCETLMADLLLWKPIP